MKYERGDEIHRGVTESTGYELYVATAKFRAFKNYARDAVISENSRTDDLMCYQAYAEFVRALYEYYVAIVKWNKSTTSLPKSFDWDYAMIDAAQQLINFYRPLRGIRDSRYQLTVPDTFGRHFRQIRNWASHADFRRMNSQLGDGKVSLAKFYRDYDFYVTLMVEHPQLSWGSGHFQGSYRWQAVEDFAAELKKI